ncbi:DUF4252 domain-containing protein [bacterium]|nr:DUF4252 domain-containing protein [bacterium]
MRSTLLIIIAAVLVAAVLPVSAQDVDVKKLPGYIDLSKITIPVDAEDVTEIDLGPGLLKMMSRFTGDEEDGEESVFSGVFSIRVKSFEAKGDQLAEIKVIMDEIEAKLRKDKWEQLVRVKQENQYTTVSMLLEGERTIGTMIMSIDDDGEVLFANIVGNFSMEKIAEFGLGLNDSTLKSLREGWDAY